MAARAADPTPAAASSGEIVVTGSRIKGLTNATSPSPVAVATSAQIALTDAVRIEDVLTKMGGADFTGGTSGASNNGGNGVSQVGLRNLGPTRTLILIDGQRLVPIFGSSFSSPDLNSIPLPLVDHVEVEKDSASSVYGADAIGGVINIITKKNSKAPRSTPTPAPPNMAAGCHTASTERWGSTPTRAT